MLRKTLEWTKRDASYIHSRVVNMNLLKLTATGLALGSLAACATPVTTLINPDTKQVVRCGGDRSGAMMGGMIGYSLQADDAAGCVKQYASQGFQVIPDAKK